MAIDPFIGASFSFFSAVGASLVMDVVRVFCVGRIDDPFPSSAATNILGNDSACIHPS